MSQNHNAWGASPQGHAGVIDEGDYYSSPGFNAPAPSQLVHAPPPYTRSEHVGQERRLETVLEALLKYFSAVTPPDPVAPNPEWIRSPSVAQLFAALARAQGEISTVVRTRQADLKAAGTYTFANIADVWRVIREPLSKNELAVTQMPIAPVRGVHQLATMLTHSSGEYIQTVMPIVFKARSDKNGGGNGGGGFAPPAGAPAAPTQMTAQQYGSLITYARRYALMALLGIATDDFEDPEDDDGNQASGRQADIQPVQQQAQSIDFSKYQQPAPTPQAYEQQAQAQSVDPIQQAYAALSTANTPNLVSAIVVEAKRVFGGADGKDPAFVAFRDAAVQKYTALGGT